MLVVQLLDLLTSTTEGWYYWDGGFYPCSAPAHEHNSSAYGTSARQHWTKCTDDEDNNGTPTDHTWSNGQCSVCNYACLHTDMTTSDATCNICGKANPDYVAPTDFKTLEKDLKYDGTVTKLTKDYTRAKAQQGIAIEEGQKVVIDLNGHKIDGANDKLTSYGFIFVVDPGGELVITDSTDNEGVITGGTGIYDPDEQIRIGGVIYNLGTVTINGGTFTGNTATYGGVISNFGTLTINDGVFTENTVSVVSKQGHQILHPHRHHELQLLPFLMMGF